MTDYEQALTIVKRLSPVEKVQLLQDISATLHDELLATEAKPKRSLLGIWAGVNLATDDIDDARRDLWNNFPREDI